MAGKLYQLNFKFKNNTDNSIKLKFRYGFPNKLTMSERIYGHGNESWQEVFIEPFQVYETMNKGLTWPNELDDTRIFVKDFQSQGGTLNDKDAVLYGGLLIGTAALLSYAISEEFKDHNNNSPSYSSNSSSFYSSNSSTNSSNYSSNSYSNSSESSSICYIVSELKNDDDAFNDLDDYYIITCMKNSRTIKIYEKRKRESWEKPYYVNSGFDPTDRFEDLKEAIRKVTENNYSYTECGCK